MGCRCNARGRDVQALRLALSLNARQVSFVASIRKAQVLKDSLVSSGADAETVAAIIAPAGYPMAATTPEEIALSVLAALVAHRRGGLTSGSGPMAGEVATQAALAPTHVVAATARCCGGAMIDAPAPQAVATSPCCGG